MKKIVKILFVVSFLLCLFLGLIKPLLKPDEVTGGENRFANKVPKLDLDSFINGKFQNDMELALADQIPFSSKFKVLKKTIDLTLKSVYYMNTEEDTYNCISNDVYKYNDSLVYFKYGFDSIKDKLDNRIYNINTIVSENPGVDFYLYYIEKDTDINFKDNTKLGAYEYIKDNVDERVVSGKFKVDSYNEFKEYFYKVDHHWNYKGSYKGYTEIANMFGIADTLDYKNEICLGSNLIGSKNSIIGGRFVFKEKLCAYTFELPKYDIYENKQKVDYYGMYKNINEKSPNEVRYSEYYGPDTAELKFDNHNSDKENLLIIGESFDNAINELLASHFNITYNIDLRYYADELGYPLDLKKFLNDNNISKVLLIGNVDYFSMDTFNIESGDEHAI